jgi:hypothetical protein
MDGIAKVRAFIRSRLLLIMLGLGCELLYLLYFVHQFPLLQYYRVDIDMGYITGHSHSGFEQFVVVFSILFALFGFAWWIVRNLSDCATLWLILGFGAVFALTMIFVYPATAIDVYIYIAHSLVLVQYHANPITTPASTFPHDPLLALADGWVAFGAPYGPLGLIIDAVPTFIVGRNLLADLLLLKLMFSAMLLIEAFLIYKILSHLSPKLALAGAIFIAWNPYALFEYCANSHNDVAMMLFVVCAILALVKNRMALAFVLIVAAVLVKFAMLPLLPLFLIYGFIHQPTNQKRLTYLALAITSSLLLVIILYAPFWQGLKTFDQLTYQDQRYMSSFSTMLTDISSTHVTLDQAKLWGRILFGAIYLVALFLSTQRLSSMLLGCFVALFFFLALAVTNFEIWYAIGPIMLAIIAARTVPSLAAFLLAYGASISATSFYYLWVWLGLSGPNLALINNIAYLITFMPAILILFGSALQQILSKESEI